MSLDPQHVSDAMPESADEDSDQPKGTNDLSVEELYRQNWEHVRHVENERLSFTSVYFVILAATVAFLSQARPSSVFAAALLVLISVLSAIGALISFRLKADMEAHGDRLKQIASESQFPQYFTFGAQSGWTTQIKLRALFPLMYTLLSVVFLAFAVFAMIRPDLMADFTSNTVEPEASLVTTPTLEPQPSMELEPAVGNEGGYKP